MSKVSLYLFAIDKIIKDKLAKKAKKENVKITFLVNKILTSYFKG